MDDLDDLTDEQAIFRESFKAFDKDGSNTMSTVDFGALMESFELKLSTDEYDRMIASLDPRGTGKIALDLFLELMSSLLKPSDNIAEVKKSMQVFDTKKNGMISTKDFAHVLRVFATDLSPEETAGLLAEANPGNAESFDYERFITLMTAKAA